MYSVFLKFNTFLLYPYKSCPRAKSGPLTQGPHISQFGRGLHEHHNHVFKSFSQIYMGVEKIFLV